MSTYRVTAPARDFNGELGGVRFREGVAEVDGETGKAVLAYCRRKGYAVVPVDPEPTEPAEPGEQSPADEGLFDPAAHDAPAVIAHLETADAAEVARVLDAEAAGKARKTIATAGEARLAALQEGTNP
jgi:hypothetical protein